MTTQDVYTYFIESLKKRMAVGGVTQVDLAKSVETSKTHFNTVLKGKKRAGAGLQKRLAAYFGLSLEEMIEEGYKSLHSDQFPVQFPSSGKQTPTREQAQSLSYTQADNNLSEMALELAAAVKRVQDDLAKWQSIVEAIGDGVVIVSAKDRVIEYQNQAHKDLFGVNLAGKKCGDAATCPSKEESPTCKAVETGKVCRGKFNLNGKTIAIIASPVRDASGRIVRVVTTSRDVSERQEALDAIAVAEERLFGVVSLLDFPVIIFNEKNKIVFANDMFRELTSATDDDLVGLDTLLECLRPLIKGFDRFEMVLRVATKTQKEEQINVQYKSGRKSVWIIRPILSPSGRYLGTVCMSRIDNKPL